MVTDKNKQSTPEQLNTFLRGMDTDTADAIIQDSQYRHSENMRLVTDSSSQTGKLSLIQGIRNRSITLNVVSSFTKTDGKYIPTYTTKDFSGYTILATTSIRNIGVVIYYDSNGWYIGRFTNDIDNEQSKLIITQIFGPGKNPIGTVNGNTKPSLDMRFEDIDNIKLYIADGVHYIRTIHIVSGTDNQRDYYNYTLNGDDTKLYIYPNAQLYPMQFLGLTSGNLTSCEVQYSYRLVNPQGNATNVAPLTGIIQVTKNISGVKEVKSWYKDKSTGSGVKLTVNNLDNTNFNRIYIYRIKYVEQGQDPVIELFYDGNLTSSVFSITDIGQTAVSTLTLDEFNNIDGTHIIPRVIEDKNDYLFAANIFYDKNSEWESLKDYDTTAKAYRLDGTTYSGDVNPWNELICTPSTVTTTKDSSGNDIVYTFDSTGEYYGGTGKNISYNFTYVDFLLDSTTKATSSDVSITWDYTIDPVISKQTSYTYKKIGKTYNTSEVKQFDTSFMPTYTDAQFTYNFKSLRRGELYRYGIVFYNKYGQRSPAMWIADIRVPDANTKGFQIFHKELDLEGSGWGLLYGRSIQLEFNVQNLPSDVTGYEIVRAKRTTNDRSTITQCVLSRNIKYWNFEKRADAVLNGYPLEPTDLICINPICYSCYPESATQKNGLTTSYPDPDYVMDKSSRNDIPGFNYNKTNTAETFLTFECISPEISFSYDESKANLTNKSLYIDLLQYQYPSITTSDYLDTIQTKYIVDTSPSYQMICSYYGSDSKDGRNYKQIQIGTNTYADKVGHNKTYNSSTKKDKYPSVFSNMLVKGRLDVGGYCCPYKWPDNYDWMYWTDLRPSQLNKTDQIDGGVTDVTKSKVYGDLISNISCLYNSTNLINTSSLKEYTYDTTQTNTWYLERGISTSVDKINVRNVFEIKDIQSVTEGSWSSFTKRKDLQSSIAGKAYCNWLFSGVYKYNDTDTGEMQSIGNGPNGRCLEIAINTESDTNKILQDTFGDMQYVTDTSSDYYTKIPYISLCGTFLCNIRQGITPYGGFDSSSRQYTNYYSYGDYQTAGNSRILTKSGDTFVGIYEHIKTHKFYDKTTIDADNYLIVNNLCNVYHIPMESDINLAIVQGVQFWRGENDSNQQIEASDVYSVYSQSVPKYEYNTVYSITPNAEVNAAITDTWFNEGYQLNNEDYRCYYSNLKTNNETIDSWGTFMVNHFLDADSGYGPITDLRRFNNKLVFWQTNAVGLYAVNDRSMITDNTNLPLTLGTGGVLDRYDYLPTSNGMAENQMCDAQSDFTLYWYDSNKNELLGLGANGEVQILSKVKSCQSTLNKQKDDNVLLHQQTNTPLINDIPELTFDKQYNELLASISNKYGSMVYNENIQAFTGWYNIIFRDKLPFANGQYLVSGQNNIMQYNDCDTYPTGYLSGLQTIKPKVQFVVNDVFYTTKVFDNQELDGILHNHPSETNPYAIDTELYKLLFEYSTPNNQNSSCTGKELTLREKNYRLVIPRANNAQYGNRMRGKALDCTISTTEDTKLPFDIQYILTKYRKSW